MREIGSALWTNSEQLSAVAAELHKMHAEIKSGQETVQNVFTDCNDIEERLHSVRSEFEGS